MSEEEEQNEEEEEERDSVTSSYEHPLLLSHKKKPWQASSSHSLHAHQITNHPESGSVYSWLMMVPCAWLLALSVAAVTGKDILLMCFKSVLALSIESLRRSIFLFIYDNHKSASVKWCQV